MSFAGDQKDWGDAVDRARVHYALLDALCAGQFVHDVEECLFEDRAQSARAGLLPDGLFGGGFESVVGKDQFEFVYGEQGLVLLDEGVPWLGENAHEVFFVERVKAYNDGQTTNQFGYEPVFHEVVAVDVPANLVGCAFFQGFRRAAGVEPDAPEILEGAFLDDLVDALERASTDEQNVVRAYLDEFLVGVFASALRRDVGDAALDYLQKRLLNAFP